MFATLPQTATLKVEPPLARALLHAAERLPRYDNKEFYSTDLQRDISNALRKQTGGFDALVAEIHDALNKRPYCALVQGLSFDEGNKVFVALNRAFGELVARPYEAPRAQLVHYIQPATDLRSARGGYESERLHTDTADWDPPVELISMVCVRADPAGGGHSRVLDVDSIREEVSDRLGDHALHLLQTQSVPFELADYCGGGVQWRTVLTESSVCWRRYTIEKGFDRAETPLEPEMLRALEGFDDVVSRTPRTIDFLMREGDLLFSDNRRTIHARTAISNGANSDRLMIRSWIRTKIPVLTAVR